MVSHNETKQNKELFYLLAAVAFVIICPENQGLVTRSTRSKSVVGDNTNNGFKSVVGEEHQQRR